MTGPPHPDEALFGGEAEIPALAACDHYAGSERFMRKALELQAARGGAFDVTLDLEDGAPVGREREHAELAVAVLQDSVNSRDAAGVRVHEAGSPHCREDVRTLVRGAGRRVAHVTLPKATSARQVAEFVNLLQGVCAEAGVAREIPVHVLIETHGGFRGLKSDRRDVARPSAPGACSKPWSVHAATRAPS